MGSPCSRPAGFNDGRPVRCHESGARGNRSGSEERQLIELIVGTILALAALSFVLQPLLFGKATESPVEPPLPPHRESTDHQAIDALREIEFDRATGKLSESDYTELKASYTQRAVDAMRAGGAPVCPRCGPRPENDALFCSNCGLMLAA